MKLQRADTTKEDLVPSPHPCSEFATTSREIRHLACVMVRFYNLPPARKHSVIALVFELAQSTSHLKVKPFL